MGKYRLDQILWIFPKSRKGRQIVPSTAVSITLVCFDPLWVSTGKICRPTCLLRKSWTRSSPPFNSHKLSNEDGLIFVFQLHRNFNQPNLRQARNLMRRQLEIGG